LPRRIVRAVFAVAVVLSAAVVVAPTAANAQYGFVWPFTTKSASQYQRIDQGWDIQTSPGAPVVAIASGTLYEANSNPGGFGDDYPFEVLDTPVSGPSGRTYNTVYYGHVHASSAFGGPGLFGHHVTAGEKIAVTNSPDCSSNDAACNGSLAPAGWLEIGFAQPGTGAPYDGGDTATIGGSDMHADLLDAPVAPSQPAAPTNLSVVGVPATSVSLSWSAAVGATAYFVYRFSAHDPLTGTMIAMTAGTSAVDKGVLLDTPYRYEVYSYNAASKSFSAHGAVVNVTTSAAAVSASPVAGSDNGYYVLSPTGGVASINAPSFGAADQQSYFAGQTAVDLATTTSPATSYGYYILSSSGGIYAYGSATFYGSPAGQSYFAGKTAVAILVLPDDTGYYVLSADGGVYGYGAAPFHGSAAGQGYFAGMTAVGFAQPPSGGYYILSNNGGIYCYGGAQFNGSAAGKSYFSGSAAVGLAEAPNGSGYYILSTAGGVYTYGAPYEGAPAGQSYFSGQSAIGMTADSSSTGYWVATDHDGIYSFGSAQVP
jgi:hypothetical protein